MNMTAPVDTSILETEGQSISIRGVNLYYDTLHVLKDINLDIRPGEFFAFLGPSGCGKTTLLRLIAGFNTAREGAVRIGGRDVLDMPPWKRNIGMVFQSYALWPHMTVRQNVAFGLEERRLPRREVQTRVDAALALVGLSHLAERRPAQLSGGQQQRVALARTIAIEPKVLLLDEPLSNLDAKMRLSVRRELRDLQQRLHLTTIFVTHDQEEANTVCDRIAVFNEGSIQQVGTPMELYEQPANLFVANFLGTANILAGRVSGEGAGRFFEVEGGGRVPIPQDATVPDNARLVFRPQYARIGVDAPGATSLDAVVRHREFLGATIRYGLMVGQTEVLVDVPFQAGDRLLDTGTQTFVSLDPRSALWLAE
ncbi:ABC transporter ATP-binding protein [Aureimonas frigidaquae]|uniref:ABC transporter n=1 Tax=Aureimonas frigidaquae TaxID=424757 RepID=A0A0P0Z3I2_9HYPH|nr:ABC transporter [Aureimonas frigidaquae]